METNRGHLLTMSKSQNNHSLHSLLLCVSIVLKLYMYCYNYSVKAFLPEMYWKTLEIVSDIEKVYI